jgi:hypothetical protein
MTRNPEQSRQIGNSASAPPGPLSESCRALVESFHRKPSAENKSPEPTL